MSQSSLFWLWWNAEILGNPMSIYIRALMFFAVLSVVLYCVQWFLMVRIKHVVEKTETDIDNIVVRMIESFRPPLFLFLAGYISLRTLFLSELARMLLDTVLIVLATYQVVVMLRVVVDFIVERSLRLKSDTHTRVAVQLLGSIAKGVVWVFGILVVLSNLGVNVTSLLAGVGIGGIAVAFALQNILKDLFSSFSLYFEKPFSVGDFIVVGKHSGTVKEIGIKTTRLKSIGGEEIIIPNSELTSARIENFKKMERRRVAKKIRISYETSSDVLERIPGWIEEIAGGIDRVKLHRAYLRDLAEDALVFEYVYFIDTANYDVYMRARQAFNLAIKRKFDQEKVAFAYPIMKMVK
jgi:small-conductance mechanosensitive channel